jgi:hypothetical protein
MIVLRHVARFTRFAILASLALTVTTPAGAADLYGSRPEVRAPARVPLALRTLSRHSAAVLTSDACWRSCTAHCGWHFQRCIGVAPLDGCLAHNNTCELVCLRQCRLAGGPLVGGAVW